MPELTNVNQVKRPLSGRSFELENPTKNQKLKKMKPILPMAQDWKPRFAGRSILFFCLIILILQSCVTIEPGEIGLKIRRGVLSEQNYTAARYRKGPRTQFVTFSTRIKELDLKTKLPTKE